MNRSELKKRLSVLLTTACVLSVIPTPAFAAEISDVDIAEATVVEVEETAFAGDDALVDEPVAEEVTEEAVVEDLLEEEPAADAADATAALADDIFVIGDGNDAVSPNVVPVSGSKVPTVSVDQVVAKQKIDLKAIAKEAGISGNFVKYVAADKASKKLVKVNKAGIVTTKGKASGWAKINAFTEKKKGAEVAAVFNIYVSVPKYQKMNAKGTKAVKTYTLTNRNDTISLDGMLKAEDENGNKINPVKILVSDKKNCFLIDETDKNNTVLKFINDKKNSGSAKVTVYYGEKAETKAEKKLCAKYTYTIKAKVPKIKAAVTVKVGKKKTVKLAALPKKAQVSWNMYAVSGDKIVSDNKLVSSNIIKIETKANKAGVLASVKVEGLAEGKVAIVPEIDGYTDWKGYVCMVTVAPGKKK